MNSQTLKRRVTNKPTTTSLSNKVSVITKFRPQVRSRHPSHSPFRRELELLPFRSLIRFGSTTEVEDGKKRVELNSIDAIRNSSSKLLMKRCFRDSNVKTANWSESISDVDNISENWKFPIVAKSHFGSRGEGNFLLSTRAEFDAWTKGKTLSHYIFEKFYNYNREYRLHVNEEGCFYTCRKMLRSDTPNDKSWFRNDSNSVWILETNPSFDKPTNWDKIILESIKALKSVGLDFGAVDLRIQSAKDKKGKVKEEPDFIIVEINSAPSMGDVTLVKYKKTLPRMLKKKFLTL
jgi:glutathione synthase/RimK-type ligase-like ATP-grasp enzyme